MSILSQVSLFCVDPTKGEASVRRTLLTNPAVRFVSFVGVDVIGNATDTLVPIDAFLSDLHDVFDGKSTLQTDGSSVVLTGLADLDDAQVDMHVDTTVKWYVQYNLNKSKLTDEIVGTLLVPCYLIHNGIFVGSRSRLRDSVAAANKQILPLLAQNPEYFGVPAGSTVVSDSVTVTVGTELEVWVATPDLKANIPEMDITQKLQNEADRVAAQRPSTRVEAHESLNVRGRSSFGVILTELSPLVAATLFVRGPVSHPTATVFLATHPNRHSNRDPVCKMVKKSMGERLKSVKDKTKDKATKLKNKVTKKKNTDMTSPTS
ncbi:glutamine synthetase [Carpediemonas membranifera]|uniref:Glutamine synthetase n=1 Tax=Carpediemonas membranifera TaxID=201153 RepID=A0A8J6B392_9EUKA|nr:glutamine synthetase [Carpediemonas membranifera]|eukprot:KAG9392024.1 glutamine synthetase [Carpediemonas membranifera]